MRYTLYRIIDDTDNCTVAQNMSYEQARTTIDLYRADYPTSKFSIESYTSETFHKTIDVDPDLYND
jgi:hypothetical protein